MNSKRTVMPTGWAANADLSYQFSELTVVDVSGSYEQSDRHYWMRLRRERDVASASRRLCAREFQRRHVAVARPYAGVALDQKL
jgi:hypothetical protein